VNNRRRRRDDWAEKLAAGWSGVTAGRVEVAARAVVAAETELAEYTAATHRYARRVEL
jgi:hypothetical protein